jgi:hypothetical protein
MIINPLHSCYSLTAEFIKNYIIIVEELLLYLFLFK